ncbi:pilus assembly protein TadG-related protein [Streptomyces sp. CA-250714]|uniref:pilus assembly protein TadG-related protein n=1 Tax=Streptomyces sp. CA-250714 TaxID=3240060 RepID=UPI003D90A179
MIKLPRRCSTGLRRLREGGRDDRGQVVVAVAGGVVVLWLFAGIVIDGGLALAAAARAQDVAQEAARTGAQQVDVHHLRNGEVRLRTAQAEADARRYVASSGDSCTVSARRDKVTVHITHRQPTQILKLIGKQTLTARASATAHAQRATSPH